MIDPTRARRRRAALAALALAAHAALPSLALADDAATAGAAAATARAPADATPEPYDGLEELLMAEADEAMAAGDFPRAWHFYWRVIKLRPTDARALREIGRAAHAMGDFGYAERALAQAAAHAPIPDPELHFLRAESLSALGRKPEARREYDRAAQAIGAEPTDRRAVIWMGRILAVRGKLGRARALYEKQLLADDGRQQHDEILMYLVEAHILADDWGGAERILRQYLSYWPDHRRAQEMLAWVLEARGHIDQELEVRRTLLARPNNDPDQLLAYARTLERANDYPSALRRYKQVDRLGIADVDRDIERIEGRLSPEVMTSGWLRDDPSGSTLGAQAGATMSLGHRWRVALTGNHEVARATPIMGAPPPPDVSLTSLNARAIYTRLTGAVLSVGGSVFAGGDDQLSAAGIAAVRTRPFRHLQLHLTGEVNQPWRESASTIHEDGAADAVTAEAYVPMFDDRVILGLTGRARRLSLDAMSEDPIHARQLFGAIGLDLVLGGDPTVQTRGEMLDHDLVWPAGLSPALVVSLRHYELDSENPFGARLVLVPRSRLDEVSAVGRKVWGDGAVGAELRGGIGQDWIRDVRLWRAGSSMLVAVTPESRVTFDFDIASESGTGLTGRRYAGVMGIHVDL